MQFPNGNIWTLQHFCYTREDPIFLRQAPGSAGIAIPPQQLWIRSTEEELIGSLWTSMQLDPNTNSATSLFMELLKKSIKKFANLCGVEISRKTTAAAAVPVQSKAPEEYEQVVPRASYSPWNKDQEFLETYSKISGSTLVDKFRCYELWKLIEQSAKLESGSIIEIGVWRGGTGGLIAKQAKRCGIKEKVFLCDTFTGVVKAGQKDTYYKGGEHADTDRAMVERLLEEQLRVDNVEILQGIFPDATGHAVEHLKFRFVHIDVDVYESAKDIVDWIWDRLVPGAIIVYDDYGFRGCSGITRYVEEQMIEQDRLVLHNLNGHAIVIKR
jgi:O-methyltransferase